jgi:hypothetical protein
MATPTAFAFSVADAIGTEIAAKIADATFDTATSQVDEELVSDAAACPADEGILIRVVPLEQQFTRTNRADELEDKAVLVVQVCRALNGTITTAKKRACANLAVQILRYFAHKSRTRITSLDAYFVDNESEVVTLFEDEVYRAIGVVMAAVTLTYRKQAATT